ncbi:MAG: hypothetical protein WBJ75_06190, partial [Pseudohongiellaceae bacterium]
MHTPRSPFRNAFTVRTCQLITALALSAATLTATAQPYPNPFMTVENWSTLPNGRTMGAVGDTDVDPDGVHIWAIIRCDATAPDRFGDECVDSDLDSVLKFDADGNVVESFGGGMFIWPHGIDVDAQGNVW